MTMNETKGLPAYIMAELDRLDAVDLNDEDAIERECARADAINKMVGVAVDVESVRIRKTSLMYEMGYGERASRMLGMGGDE